MPTQTVPTALNSMPALARIAPAKAPTQAPRAVPDPTQTMVQSMPPALAPVANTVAPMLAESQHAIDADNDVLHGYDAQMTRIMQAVQAQRLVTINRAQMLRKALPVIGLFTLIGGGAAGLSGALAALGGGLAGLSQGMNQKYQEAWKTYDAKVKALLAQAHDMQARIGNVLKDKTLNTDQKIKLVGVLGSASAAYQRALTSERNTDARDATSRQNTLERILAAHKQVGDALAKTQTLHDQTSQAMAEPSPAQVTQAIHAAFGAGPADADQQAKFLAAHHTQGVRLGELANLNLSRVPGADWNKSLTAVINHQRANNGLSAPALERSERGARARSDPRDVLARSAGMSPDELDFDAIQRAGGKSMNSITGYQGKNGARIYNAINARAAELTKRFSGSVMNTLAFGASVRAREQALAKVSEKATMVAGYVGSLNRNIDKLRAAAAAFGSSDLPAINWARLKAQKWSGDPREIAYQQALYDVVVDYGRVLSGATGASAGSDASRGEAAAHLPDNLNPQSLNAALDQISAAAKNFDDSFASDAASIRRALGAQGVMQPVAAPSDSDAPPAPGASASSADDALVNKWLH